MPWLELMKNLTSVCVYCGSGLGANPIHAEAARILGQSMAEAGVRYMIFLVTAAAGGMLAVVSWRRFTTLLARAEHFGEAATCPQCKAWGKFKVLAQERSNADDPPEAGRPHWLSVRCKQCEAVWKLQ